jgi:methyl-accepting chemotaxis protein
MLIRKGLGGLLIKDYKTRLINKILPPGLRHGSGKKGHACGIPIGSLRDLDKRLIAIGTALETTVKKVEPEFMQLALDLQSISADTAAMTRQIEDTVNLIGGESEANMLVKIGKYVRESLEQLEHRQVEVRDNLDHVHTIEDKLNAFFRMCSEIEKIALYLRIVGLNIGIESSRSAESQEMFAVIAQDIKLFSENVIKISERIREAVKTARTSQLQACDEISKGLNQLKALGKEARDAVRNSVKEIEQLLEFTLVALEKIGATTRQISLQVGEIVVAIQFHDNLSQRVEHVVKGLHDVVNMNSDAKTALDPDDVDAGKMTAAHAIVNLQNAQIKQAISEIDSVYQKSRSAFAAIGRETHGLASSLSSLSQKDSDAGPDPESTVKDPFATLKPALSNLDRLLCRGGGLIGRIRDTSMHASEAAKQLFSYMGQIRKLSHETHIKALNAIVNAAHMGDAGKTQEVLAQEIKILSDNTRHFVDDVSGVLDSISGYVRDLDDKTGQSSDVVCAANETDEGEILPDAGIEQISELYTRFNDNSADVFQRAEPLKDKIWRAGSGLEFLPALAGNLAEQHKQLEEIRDILKPWAGGDSAETEAMIARYTMQQEREVHNKLIVARARDDKASDTEDLRRNHAETEVKAADSQAGFLNEGVAKEDSKSTVELFSDENAEDKEDFGDNVDLF